MLISMPHGTSTILGAFQAIWALLEADELRPQLLNYPLMKSSPVNSFRGETSTYFAATQQGAG
jgi:hypothetical protein